MKNFGLTPVRGEGGPIHPDDKDCGYKGNDEEVYFRLLKAYADYYPKGVLKAYCSKPYLIKRLSE